VIRHDLINVNIADVVERVKIVHVPRDIVVEIDIANDLVHHPNLVLHHPHLHHVQVLDRITLEVAADIANNITDIMNGLVHHQALAQVPLHPAHHVLHHRHRAHLVHRHRALHPLLVLHRQVHHPHALHRHLHHVQVGQVRHLHRVLHQAHLHHHVLPHRRAHHLAPHRAHLHHHALRHRHRHHPVQVGRRAHLAHHVPLLLHHLALVVQERDVQEDDDGKRIDV